MDKIVNNLKKAGIFNTVLIVITIILEVLGLLVMSAFSSDRLLNIANIIALLSGLFYIYTGYRKGSAKFYKLFMVIYAIASIYDVIADGAYCLSNKITLLCIIELLANGLAAFAVVVLAFTKNFGKKTSLLLGKFNLSLTVISDLIFGLFIFKDMMVYIDIYFGDIVLACLCLLFIIAKYTNKDTRGAK